MLTVAGLKMCVTNWRIQQDCVLVRVQDRCLFLQIPMGTRGPYIDYWGRWAAVNRAVKTVCSQVSIHRYDLLLVWANPS